MKVHYDIRNPPSSPYRPLKFLQPSTPYLYGNWPGGTNQLVNTKQGLRLLVGKF